MDVDRHNYWPLLVSIKNYLKIVPNLILPSLANVYLVSSLTRLLWAITFVGDVQRKKEIQTVLTISKIEIVQKI